MKKILGLLVFSVLVLGQSCEKEKSKNQTDSPSGIYGTWDVDSTKVSTYVNGDMHMSVVSQDFPHTVKISQTSVTEFHWGNTETAAFTMLNSSQALTDLDFNGKLDTTNIHHPSSGSLSLEWVASVDTVSSDIHETVHHMQLSR